MPNNIDNALRAAIRSMENVIIPGMNKENPLAQEQATIITKLLHLLRERIPYVQQRDWLELKIYFEMFNELSNDIVLLLPENIGNLQRLQKEVTEILETPTPDPFWLAQLAEQLRSTLSELVRASSDQNDTQRRRIESVIVLGSKRVLDLQRAWFIPTGLVADSNSIPDLDRQIRMK